MLCSFNIYFTYVKNHLQKVFANDFRMKSFNYEIHIITIIIIILSLRLINIEFATLLLYFYFNILY